MNDAAQAGHTEVEGSRLALQKAVNADVKAFAQQMVDDHSKAGEELIALATRKGVKVPAEPSIAQKAKLQLLKSADGAAFDRRYAQTLGVAAHEDTVKLFDKASRTAKDPDIKAFAVKTLPTLRHHLEMARKVNAVAKAEGNRKGAGDRKQ